MATHSQAIQICMTVVQGCWNDISATARAADESGLHSIGIADSPMVVRDMHLACAACALNTSKTKIITGVTNPVTRHPSVMASAFLQLEELAPERIICGIATGDSALWGVGLKPAKLAELREYIVAVKALLRGERADWKGSSFSAIWSQFEPFDLPVYVACAGPKSIHMAAQVADGLILSVGIAPEDLDWARQRIEASCAEIGRDPSELDVWQYTEITFAESAAAAAATSAPITAQRAMLIPEPKAEPLPACGRAPTAGVAVGMGLTTSTVEVGVGVGSVAITTASTDVP